PSSTWPAHSFTEAASPTFRSPIGPSFQAPPFENFVGISQPRPSPSLRNGEGDDLSRLPLHAKRGEGRGGGRIGGTVVATTPAVPYDAAFLTPALLPTLFGFLLILFRCTALCSVAPLFG